MIDILPFLKSLPHGKFPALAHGEFRVYWAGQTVSLLGTWMENIGMSWLVFSMTDSALLLSLMETARFLPVTVFSLFAGTLVDKFPKRTILLFTQTVSMALSFLLAALVFAQAARYGYILAAALALGFTNTLDGPARQAFTVELTGRDDLMNAVALSSVTYNLARIVGPTLGAAVLAGWGAGWCFLLNGVSFLAVIFSLLRIHPTPAARGDAAGGVLREVGDGLKYVAAERTLRNTLLLVTIVGVFAFNYEILVPAFTRDVLHQDARVYGLLTSCLGVGSVLGAVLVSFLSRSGPRRGVLVGSAAAVSVLLVAIGFTRSYALTAALLAVSGVFLILLNTTADATLQLAARDDYRGRVMGASALVNAGTAPLGYLLSGVAADRLGAGAGFLLSGACALAFLGVFHGFTGRRGATPR